MIKVLHVITRLDMGGSAQNTLLSCIGLAKKAYDVTLVHGLSSESRMTNTEQEVVERLVSKAVREGVKMIPLSSLVRSIHPSKDLLSLFCLYRILKEENPEILHTHTSKAGVVGRWAGRFANVPCILHTPHGHVFYGHFGKWKSNLFLLLEKLTAYATDHVIALTEGEKNDYLKRFLYPTDRITVIHSGIDVDRYAASSLNREIKLCSLNLRTDSKVIGTVGWLLPIKAPTVLLNAMIQIWKIHPHVELVYVGKGPLLDSLRAHAAREGVSDRVNFLGWREDVHEILPILDLFVLPSLNEGMGRVLVEAMAAGKPIIATRTGGIPDLVRNGENGLLVPPGDDKALAAAIDYILRNPDLAERMGNNGRKYCRRFTIESMVEKIDRLYRELIQSG